MPSQLVENVLVVYAGSMCFFMFSAGCTLLRKKIYTSALVSYVMSLIGTTFLILWVLKL